ncbi:MAG: hypothetical protein MJ166_03280 [Clostridia bacterium]|nr:hypothetical protein [Clostridia bacterium]
MTKVTDIKTGIKAPTKKILFFILIILVVLIVGFNSFVIVPTGYSGVRVRLGQVSKETLEPGVHLQIPFVDQIKSVNNKQQDVTLEGQFWAETEERAALYYEGITITYQIAPGASSWLLSNVNDYQNNLITSSLVSSALKTASKKYPATDATNRGIIEPAVTLALQDSVDEKYGVDVVTIIKVVINNADYEESYKQRIADLQAAQIQYQTQQFENQRAIELAEADATVTRTNAQAEADALLIEAQAEADANKIREESLSPIVLYYEYLQRWDGRLPMVQGEGAMPFIDVTSLMDEEAPVVVNTEVAEE